MDDKELKEKINVLIEGLDNLLNSSRTEKQKNAALDTVYNEINKLEDAEDIKTYISKFQEAYAENKEMLETMEEDMQEEDKQYNTSHDKDEMLVNLENLDKKVEIVSNRVESVISISKQYNDEEYKSLMEPLVESSKVEAKNSNEMLEAFEEPFNKISESDEYKKVSKEKKKTEQAIELLEEYNKALQELKDAKKENPVDADKVKELEEQLDEIKDKIENNSKCQNLNNCVIKKFKGGKPEFVSLDDCLKNNYPADGFIDGKVYDKADTSKIRSNLNRRKEYFENKIYDHFRNNPELITRYNDLYKNLPNPKLMADATNEDIHKFLEDCQKIKDYLRKKAKIANNKAKNLEEVKERLELEKKLSDSEYFKKMASDDDKKNFSIMVVNNTNKFKNRRKFWKQQGCSGLVAFFKAFSKKKTMETAKQVQYSYFKTQQKNKREKSFRAGLQKISRDNNRIVNETDKSDAYNYMIENNRSDEER